MSYSLMIPYSAWWLYVIYLIILFFLYFFSLIILCDLFYKYYLANLGKMCTLASIIHHETIVNDIIRVVVVDVRDATGRVPAPTKEVKIVV